MSSGRDLYRVYHHAPCRSRAHLPPFRPLSKSGAHAVSQPSSRSLSQATRMCSGLNGLLFGIQGTPYLIALVSPFWGRAFSCNPFLAPLYTVARPSG